MKAAFDLLKVLNWVDGIQLDEMPGTYIRDLCCLCDISRQSIYVLSPLRREMPEAFGIILLCKLEKGEKKTPEEPPRLHDTVILKDAESILDWLRRLDVEQTMLVSLAPGER